MSRKHQSPRSFMVTLGAACALAAAFSGCGEDTDPGTSGSSAGSSGQNAEAGDGNEPTGSGGSLSSSGGDGSNESGTGGSGAKNGSGGAGAPGSGGSSGAGEANGGAPIEEPEGGSGGAPEVGGEGGAGDGYENLSLWCAYDEEVGAGGADGAGGAGSDAPDVSIAVHPILGQILVDAAGLTLYTVGRDTPGDCDFAPTTDCTTTACLNTWPVFYAGDRVLGAGLDDGVFGTYERPDGTPQTTYYGWPLYYYLNDTATGMVQGQGKQGLWHAAELTPAVIVLMRTPGTTVNYLATSNGRSLYVHTLDTLGNGADDPVSACTGKCLKDHPPLSLHGISVVSSLEPADFTLFDRADGEGLQVAYKGAPLYFDKATKKPGQIADPMPENWGLALK